MGDNVIVLEGYVFLIPFPYVRSALYWFLVKRCDW